MARALLKKDDYSRLAEKDLATVVKHFQDYEKKFPEGFAEFIKEAFVTRTLKTISSYLS